MYIRALVWPSGETPRRFTALRRWRGHREVSADTLRWYLVRTANFGEDLPFSLAAMRLMHNADLCDCLGNLVNRAVRPTETEIQL